MSYVKTFEGVAGKITFSLNRDLDEREMALFEQNMIDLVEGFKLDPHGNIPGDCKPAVGTRAYKLAKESAYKGWYELDTNKELDKSVYHQLIMFIHKDLHLSLADAKKKVENAFYTKEPLRTNGWYVGTKEYIQDHLQYEYDSIFHERNLSPLFELKFEQMTDDEQFKYYL